MEKNKLKDLPQREVRQHHVHV